MLLVAAARPRRRAPTASQAEGGRSGQRGADPARGHGSDQRARIRPARGTAGSCGRRKGRGSGGKGRGEGGRVWRGEWWARERAGRGFQGDCRHGSEWPESSGIWPAADVEGGGRREEEGGALRWGSAGRARVSWFCLVGGRRRAGGRILAVG
jgi:hypothetical protein